MRVKTIILRYFACFLLIGALLSFIYKHTNEITPFKPDTDNAGLKLADGFGANKIADNIGRARHIIVTKDGSIYIKLFRLVNGKGILFLQDNDKDGKYETQLAFGDYAGTGITIKKGYLYASSDKEIFRYKLDDAEKVIDPTKPEKIITGLIAGRQHQTKSIVLDNDDHIYVNIGSPSNSCQEMDRGLESKGKAGCPILDSAGGIWQFKADKLNQTYVDGVKYATGLRNVMGLDWNTQNNTLYVMQHGRDNLSSSWPKLYTDKQSAELPAEVMYMLKKGDNAGWPYTYYDPFLNKKILAPEYGGDGKIEGSKEFIDPIVAFPAHMAPNALLFYTGNMFPERYKNGAFVAFHGSWNRAPEKQAGYFVVFVPFKDGKPTGKWEVFADNFSGQAEIMAPKEAIHRPCGLAQGPDGSLFVTDDVKGAVYRIGYTKK
ncbi:PQQ-dependent sugar dehydrogenase [Pedobacter boryungensis]|uniref:PQQ-dependent sugar dehydrogenase n=1 Tax=Pedobacter boryungensis TaxID=869962 RepID=A0ABX2DAF6_9SPHI|nr:PQQ-dependent sugar dehydrogenase [Pedobacter boryungensis]NQX31033.1 PQQ-dependent sugar dehydrogenase [Pedobacter boryungensis]